VKALASLLLLISPLALLASDNKTAVSNAQAAKCFGQVVAPIHVDLFSDYQCPSCRQLYFDTVKKMIVENVSTGKVYLVHHDFPLPMHKYAREAARYANAAASLNKFVTVEDQLFEKQPVWSEKGNVDEIVAEVLSPADMKRVRELVKDPKLDQAIDADIALGQKSNVRSTPTMIFTHNMRTYPVAQAVTYPILKRFIDELLTK
jgi:protein-disulfide isomerase